MRMRILCLGALFALTAGLGVFAIAAPSDLDPIGGDRVAAGLLDADLEFTLLRAGELSSIQFCVGCLVSQFDICANRPGGTPCGHDPGVCRCGFCQGTFDCFAFLFPRS